MSTKTSSCTETMLAPCTAAARAVKILFLNMERAFEIYENLHHYYTAGASYYCSDVPR